MLSVDKLVTCAYNMSHEVYMSRLQYHLVKCRRANKEQKKYVCLFDSTHHVDPSEELIHELSCPNRRVIEDTKYQVDGERSSAEICARHFMPFKVPPSGEDWDDDPPYFYDPERVSASKLVIRMMNGGTRSERRDFRERERRRMQRLNFCLVPAPHLCKKG